MAVPDQRPEPDPAGDGEPGIRHRGYSDYRDATTAGGAKAADEDDSVPTWPSAVLDPGGAQCALCTRSGVSRDLWIGHLPADTWVWSSRMSVCVDCAALLEQGRDADLADRLSDRDVDPNEPDPVARVRRLRERLRAVRVTPPARPDVTALVDAGFAPLEYFTGSTAELGPLWPAEHSRALPELRDDAWDAAQPIWFVESPWPGLSVTDVLTALWPWVEQDRATLDRSAWHDRVLEAFRWSQTEALTALSHAQRGR